MYVFYQDLLFQHNNQLTIIVEPVLQYIFLQLKCNFITRNFKKFNVSKLCVLRSLIKLQSIEMGQNYRLNIF